MISCSVVVAVAAVGLVLQGQLDEQGGGSGAVEQERMIAWKLLQQLQLKLKHLHDGGDGGGVLKGRREIGQGGGVVCPLGICEEQG